MWLKSLNCKARNAYFDDLFHTLNMHATNLKQIISTKLDEFQHYLVNRNIYKCALTWWYIKEHKFSTIAMLERHMFGILAKYIKRKWFFSIARLLIAIYRCHFQTNHMKQMIFVIRIGHWTPWIRCSEPKGFAIVCRAKFDLTNEFDVEFEDEPKCEKFLDKCDPPYVALWWKHYRVLS
jgi:hypothetical protein